MADALGESEAFVDFQERLSRVASVDRPVLLIGERGTGKELAASRLHYLSQRWERPLVALNCAALSPTLIESELFGHEAGAFTGATVKRPGRFEAADGGTLFLDEIGIVPVEVQEKILRVVEYGSFERVGSSEATQVDVRIIGATNADLPALVKKGAFMQDLVDRLSFEVLFVPPLREREGDVLLLAKHFSSRMSFELGRDDIPEFSESALEVLHAHPWPGNVRELKNVVERAVYRSASLMVDSQDIVLDPFISPYGLASGVLPKVESRLEESAAEEPKEELVHLFDMHLKEAVKELELRMLKRALSETRFNQRIAAKKLGLSYDQFRGVYRKHEAALQE